MPSSDFDPPGRPAENPAARALAVLTNEPPVATHSRPSIAGRSLSRVTARGFPRCSRAQARNPATS
ncbi:MAG TPA: hypothetical protein VL285_07255 [Bryobacteraceae bacterium]|nr:hypothetical protein [Bryobacteraceae bacterium]